MLQTQKARKRLVLHIGTEKTGTTSIQTFLTRNSSTLLHQNGILYPLDPRLFHGINHCPVAGSFLKRNACEFVSHDVLSRPEVIRETLVAEYRRKSPEVMLLSSEHFSSRFREEEIFSLADVLEPFDVRIIVYVKRQDLMAASAFSTRVRGGGREWLDLQYVHSNIFYFNLWDMLTEWSSGFEKKRISVRVFDPNMLVNQDVVSDFMALMNVKDLSRFLGVESLNDSLTSKQARFMVEMNRYLPTWEEAVSQNRIQAYWDSNSIREKTIQTLMELPSFAEAPPISHVIPAMARQRLVDEFTESNNKVAEVYLSRKELFCNEENRPLDTSHEYKTDDFRPTRADLFDVIISTFGQIARLEPKEPGNMTDAGSVLTALQKEHEELRQQLETITGAWSWRLTCPFRWIKDRLLKPVAQLWNRSIRK